MITLGRYVGGQIIRTGLPPEAPGPVPGLPPGTGLYPGTQLFPSLTVFPTDGPGLGSGE